MTVALWVINALLASVFFGAGLMKLVRPNEALAASGMGYVEDFTARTIKLLGLVEVLGAIGLILPLALGIAPILTPLAAIGHFTMMIGAITVHRRRHETWVPPLVLAVLAAASAVLGFLVVL